MDFFADNLDKLDLKDLKIQLLSDTLNKLKLAVSVQNVTIRRNPETRLIIHALCTSDFTPQKVNCISLSCRGNIFYLYYSSDIVEPHSEGFVANTGQTKRQLPRRHYIVNVALSGNPNV